MYLHRLLPLMSVFLMPLFNQEGPALCILDCGAWLELTDFTKMKNVEKLDFDNMFCCKNVVGCLGLFFCSFFVVWFCFVFLYWRSSALKFEKKFHVDLILNCDEIFLHQIFLTLSHTVVRENKSKLKEKTSCYSPVISLRQKIGNKILKMVLMF